ncbi:sorting nexin-25-like [Heptranchias perlo]|uniref:sorting nexin-25-like n=1 Tax=Heptranchias perlo TaxID=212740 RepID=UPI0035597DB6
MSEEKCPGEKCTILEEVINKICDADFINQALIEFLDKDLPATIEKEVIPDVPPKTEKNAEIITECYISNGKMKKKSKKTNVPRKFQKYFKKIFKKSKKREDPEVDSTVDGTDEIDGQFRCLSYSDALYLENRVDDSADEEHLISSDEISKWAERTVPASSLRNCKITISEISWDEMEDPSCTIDVEDLKVAEDCWSVHRKFHEFQDLQKELNKTLSSFVEAKLSSVNGMSPDQINNEFKEDVKRQLTVFLEMLVSEESILCNDIVLNFFSPNDQIREYWGLLTSLFTEDDEESYAGSDTSEDLCDLDVDDVGGEVEPPGTNPENRETQAWESVEFQTFEKCESDKYLGFRTISGTENPVAADLHLNCVDGRKRRKCAPQKKIERTAEQPECISSQLCELLGEIICAESSNVNRTILLLVKSFLQKYLQKKLDQFFNKEQMTICIDRLRETLWPNGKPAEPPPNRTNEEKAFAKERAEELLQNRVSALPPFLLNKKANARTLFAIFQDAETNKRLVYNVLVFLLFELIPGIKVSWNGDVMPCLKNLDVDELNDKPL